ncbi:phage tail sheath subtilisin-like domain-containing protein [Thermus scotoductus]|nr:phage tail sheath subtilisin-like domain-containing protein [Thermus scotoductus]
MVGIYFEGRQIILPGAYATTKVEAFNIQRPPLFKRLAVIAPAQGGVPRGFTRITSGSEAARVLRGGVGLALVDLALDPSREMPGAGEILFYRVNAAVPASLDMGNLRLEARPEHAGIYSNGFRAKRELHPDGYYLLWVEDPASGVLEESPPLGPALELIYYGSGTPSAQVSTDSEGQKHLILQGGAPYENHDILIGGSGIKSIQELADFLNGTSVWGARVLHKHHLYDPGGFPNGALTFSGGRAVLDLGLSAQLQWLKASTLVNATATGGTDTATGMGWLYFTGGNEGPPVTLGDYEAALTALEAEDVQAVVVGSPDPAVQAMAVAHCEYMSHPKQRKERIFFGGPGLELNAQAQKEAAIALARELQSERAVIVGTPVRRRNLRTGQVDDLPPLHVAAMLAGMWCAARPEVPLTNKTIYAQGLTYRYSQVDLEDFLKEGVVPIAQDPEQGTYIIVQGLTTWRKDTNPMRRKLQGVSIRDYLTRKLRLYTKKFVGAVGDATTVESILNAVETALAEEVRGGRNPEGVLTTGTGPDGEPEPAYKNITAVFDGIELVAVEFEAHPVGEVAYITVTAFLTPTRIVRSA